MLNQFLVAKTSDKDAMLEAKTMQFFFLFFFLENLQKKKKNVLGCVHTTALLTSKNRFRLCSHYWPVTVP